VAYREVGDHLIVTLDEDQLDLKGMHSSGKNTWYVYKGHLMDPAGFGPGNQPKDAPATKPRDRGFSFKMPGYTQTFWSNDPICEKSPNFKMYEALHFDAQGNYRRPANATVVKHLFTSAAVMQQVRDFLGLPVMINSWYRDPATNARVGGAIQSRHMVGDGVDFRVEGMRSYDVYEALNGWWGNRGGLASSSVFTHIDVRGYRARWSYGF
jgi:hypothetical protein